MGSVGDRFKKIRSIMGNTQLEFGNIFGLSGDAVSSIERNKTNPTFVILLKLEEIGINSRWLITGEGNLYNDEKISTNIQVHFKEILPLINQLAELTPIEIEKVINFIDSLKKK